MASPSKPIAACMVAASIGIGYGLLRLWKNYQRARIPVGGYSLRTGSIIQTEEGVSAIVDGDKGNTGIKSLKVRISYEPSGNARLQITDPENDRWTVPEELAPLNHTPSSISARQLFTLAIENNSLCVSRIESAKDALIRIDLSKLVYSDQYINFQLGMPDNPYLVGLGMHNQHRLNLQEDTTSSIWNVDQFSLPYGDNLYGAHPHFVEIRNGKAHGVLLRNSNGQDWRLTKSGLNVVTIGGIIDLFVFAGPSVDEASRQYQALVGTPWMPPYWSLGWQQCRYGFKDLSEIKNVYNEYMRQAIPLEVIYTDIDYMHRWRNFTNDPINFELEDLREFVKTVHEDDRRINIIVDPCIGEAKTGEYKAYDNGLEQDVFIKNVGGEVYRSRQWAGDVAILDPTAKNIKQYFTDELVQWWSETGIQFDGIWLDMNEFASFVDGEVNTTMPSDWFENHTVLWKYPAWVEDDTKRAKINAMTAQEVLDTDFEKEYRLTNGGNREYEDPLNNPPYHVHNCVAGIDSFSNVQHEDTGFGISELIWGKPEKPKPLTHKTFDMTARFANGAQQYNMHNLYGIGMARVVRAAAEALPREGRPFMLTRSTFSGSGSFCGTWNGDNVGNWEQYRSGVHAVIKAQVHGLLYVGDDSGGFADDLNLSDEEYDELLCRWTALSSFFPFARNHICLGSVRVHQPWESPNAAIAARNVLRLRYELLPYIYTQFARAHLAEIGMIIRALYFDHIDDETARDVQDQFMFGPAIMVAPINAYQQTSRAVYFPKGCQWYNWFNGAIMSECGGTSANANSSIEDDTIIPLFGKGGQVVVTQEARLTTKACRETPATLTIMYDSSNAEGVATGELFWDNGNQRQLKTYVRTKYTAGEMGFRAEATATGYKDTLPPIHTLRVYGLGRVPSSVLLAVEDHSPKTQPIVSQNAETGAIIIDLKSCGLNLSTSFEMSFVH